jgi:hypothetical protein
VGDPRRVPGAHVAPGCDIGRRGCVSDGGIDGGIDVGLRDEDGGDASDRSQRTSWDGSLAWSRCCAARRNYDRVNDTDDHIRPECHHGALIRDERSPSIGYSIVGCSFVAGLRVDGNVVVASDDPRGRSIRSDHDYDYDDDRRADPDDPSLVEPNTDAGVSRPAE